MGFSCNQTQIFEKLAVHQNIQAGGRSRDPHERLLSDPIWHPTLHNRTPRLHQQREDWFLLNELENLREKKDRYNNTE